MEEHGRAGKRRKLNNIRRQVPHVTASALAAILLAVKQDGLPEGGISRWSLRKARDVEATTQTPLGPIHQVLQLYTPSGELRDVHVAHPLALLWATVDRCKPFADFFLDRLRACPVTPEAPWRLILYTDEVTPGNPLAHENHRRFQAVYFSFLEFEHNALSREDAWLCCAAMSSSTVKELCAGLSQMVGAILKLFFSSDNTDLMVTGLLLPFAAGGVRFFAKLAIVIQDGGAHKSCWHARGDSASRFCILCRNLFTAKSRIVDEDRTNLLRCNVIRDSELIPATNDDLRRTARQLAAAHGTMSKERFNKLQQVLGMTFHPRSMLLDRELDRVLPIADVYQHDWMHCLLVDGVYNVQLYLLFEAFLDDGCADIYELVRGYVAKWRWPSRLHGDHLSEIFAANRKESSRKAQHVKAQASDLLSLTGVIALFVVTVLVPSSSGHCLQACQALLALTNIIDVLTSVAKGRSYPNLLRASVHDYLTRFTDAFGYEWLTPKFHWLLHLASQLEKQGSLLNCFALERKHRWGKRFATDIENTKYGDAALIRELICMQLARMNNPQTFDFSIGLVGARDAPRQLARALADILEVGYDVPIQTAQESRFSPIAACSKGDVVFIRERDAFFASEVLCHAACAGIAITVVGDWSLKRTDAVASWSEWHTTTANVVVETKDIIDVAVYTRCADGVVKTLLPWELRNR